MADGTNTDNPLKFLEEGMIKISQILFNGTAGTNTDNQAKTANDEFRLMFPQLGRLSDDNTDDQGLLGSNMQIDQLSLFYQLHDETLYKLYVGGTVVSIIFLALKFLLYFGVPNDLRRLPDKLVHHLSSTLLMSHIVLLISIVVISGQSPDEVGNEISVGLSVVLHFSVLSVFFFMNALVFRLFRSSSSTPDKGQSPQSKYCLYAYGIPACIVFGAVILYWTLPALSTFRPNYAAPLFCWPFGLVALILFLLFPLGVLLAVNIVLLLLTALKSAFQPCCSRGQLKMYNQYMNPKPGDHDGCCCRFIQYFLLNVLVGVTWIFGLLSINEYRFLVFFMLNTLQGPFVFFVFTPFRKLCCRQTAEDDSVALIHKTAMA